MSAVYGVAVAPEYLRPRNFACALVEEDRRVVAVGDRAVLNQDVRAAPAVHRPHPAMHNLAVDQT
jgi:hypothetical protein